MNLYAETIPLHTETLFSWYINELQMNGLDLSDYKYLIYKKKKVGDTRIIDSLLELHSKIFLTSKIDSTENTLQPFLSIFYKNGNIPYKYLDSIYDSKVFCPVCLQERYEANKDIRFYLKNQLPLKHVCCKHQCKLRKFDKLDDINSNISSIISSSYELTSNIDINLELKFANFINYIFDNQREFNYELLYKALIEEYARNLKVVKLGKVSTILDEIPEHLQLNHLKDRSTVYLLDYLYKSNLEIGHEIFCILLFVTFEDVTRFHEAVLRAKEHEQWNLSMYKTLLKFTVLQLRLSKDYRVTLKNNEMEVEMIVNNYRIDEINEKIVDEIIVKKFHGRYWNIPRKYLSMIQSDKVLVILDLYTNQLLSISKENLIKSIKTTSNIESEYTFKNDEYIYKEIMKTLRR